MKTSLKPYVNRFILTLVISIIFVGLINELAHLVLKDREDRPPETIKIIIPLGTAERVAAGQSEPTLPTELTFVVGDTLQVDNQDIVPHELGPLYIPPGNRASLGIEDANKYTLGCTFQPSKYLDFNVRPRTTANSRVQALGLATPPTAMFLFVYSLIVFPINKTAEPLAAKE